MSWNGRLLDEMFYYPPEVERTNVAYAPGRPTVGERHDSILRRLADASSFAMFSQATSLLAWRSAIQSAHRSVRNVAIGRVQMDEEAIRAGEQNPSPLVFLTVEDDVIEDEELVVPWAPLMGMPIYRATQEPAIRAWMLEAGEPTNAPPYAMWGAEEILRPDGRTITDILMIRRDFRL